MRAGPWTGRTWSNGLWAACLTTPYPRTVSAPDTVPLPSQPTPRPRPPFAVPPAAVVRGSEYRVVARSAPDGVGTVDTARSSLPLDAGWDGVATGLAGPGDLLAGAFAACLLKNLARSAALLRFRYDEAEVEVVMRRQDNPPRFVEVGYEMRIATVEPARRVELMHRNVRRHGTVYNTLASVCEVHGTVVVVPPGPRV